jgi:hypothetical protein
MSNETSRPLSEYAKVARTQMYFVENMMVFATSQSFDPGEACDSIACPGGFSLLPRFGSGADSRADAATISIPM